MHRFGSQTLEGVLGGFPFEPWTGRLPRHDLSGTAIGLLIRPGVGHEGSMGRHIWQSHGVSGLIYVDLFDVGWSVPMAGSLVVWWIKTSHLS